MLKSIRNASLLSGAVLIDLISKSYIFQMYAFGVKTPIFFVLYIFPLYNTGVAWSMASSFGSIVAIVSFFVSVMCSVEFFRHPSFAWGMICAGGLANTYDRLIFGAVRDFIALSYAGYTFPIFNIADCYLTIGISLLLWQQSFRDSRGYNLLGDH